MEELRAELGELEPELKSSMDEATRLTQALQQHKAQVAASRDLLVQQEDRVKVRRWAVFDSFESFTYAEASADVRD